MVFVLSLALAAIGALAWKEADNWHSAQRAVRSELQLQSLSLSAVLEAAFDATEQALSGVAYRLALHQGGPALELDLRGHLLRAPSLSDLRFYGPDKQLSERASLAPLASHALPLWVQQHTAQGRLSGYGQDGDGLAFYRMARAADGRVQGTVYATMAAGYFHTVSAQNLRSHVEASCLVGPQGEVLLDLGEADASCREGASNALLRHLNAQIGGHGSSVQAVDARLVLVRQLENHPLRVVQIAADKPTLDLWEASARYSLLAMLLIALAAWMFMRHFRNSLRVRSLADQQLLQLQAHLQASQDLLDRLSQQLPGVIYQYLVRADGTSAFPYASQGLEDLFGVAPANFQLDAAPVFERVYADDRVALAASTQASLQSMSAWQHEFRIHHSSGKLRWLSGLANPMRLEGGDTLWHGFIQDVTERKLLEARLKLAASVFTSAKEGILITDAAGTIVDVNATFNLITGYSRTEALGKSPRMLSSGRQPPAFYAEMWHSLQTKGHWYGEVWNRRKSGDVYAEMLTISSVRDESGATQNYVALFSDITPFKTHQQELERIAHYDALTGLPNRILLADRLHQALIQSQRRRHCLAVVFLDLDGFKAINDTHGHAAGDALLIALASHMQSALREGDTLARIGGDEFVAILADLEHAHDCEPILMRLLQSACEPVQRGEVELRVSASMGVTLYPQDGADVDLLMRQADQAMYAAKLAGKNRYHLFDVAQDAAIRQQHNSLERMEQALAQGQFALYYQPKVHLQSGLVVGAEALIRWNHPERGLLDPVQFLPLMENQPLGIRLGEWVIHSALVQCSHWQTLGLRLPVSVNISALQLLQDDFAARLRGLLAQCPDVRPELLELEVLETSAFGDLGRVSAIIAKCQAMGIRFALDDFGTGYSSLAYLKHLPVETLKIDRSFVHDMLDDANDLAIVNGIIGLARAFGREVVAEGVESSAQRDLLVSLGCNVAQGFGIAGPMSAEAIPAWVSQWQAHPGACYPQDPPGAS